ncbi:MAG: hypothetical protein HZC28_08240 [Spirochaetes bacterium]|nr:hypothetical protein [Spirochaetota bacterium]
MKALIVVLLFSTAFFTAGADKEISDIAISASVSTNEGFIGDAVKYSVRVLHATNVTIFFPQQLDSVGKWEVLDAAVQKPVRRKDGAVTESVVYSLAAYEHGVITIPGVEIRAVKREDSSESVFTSRPFAVLIRPILTNGSKMDLPDIKKEASLPLPLWFWIVIGSIIAVAAAVILVIKLWPRVVKAVTAAEVSEDVVALNAINALLAKNYIDLGEYKLFYFELSEILRAYLSKRFDLHVLEATTSEIAAIMEQAETPECADIANFLAYADIIKFAKAIPSAVENAAHIEFVRGFISRTRRVEIAAATA